MPRTPLLFMSIGFILGVIIARNAVTMHAPERGTVYVTLLITAFVLWKVINRGRREAIANAVAVAVAEATANAEAHATAVAQQAVSVYIGAQETLKVLDSVADSSSIETHATTKELPDAEAFNVRKGNARSVRKSRVLDSA